MLLNQTEPPAPDGANSSGMSRTEWLKTEMLERIQSGAWSVGSSIPSERALMKEFGVSRIPVREALSTLDALGVLDISHGRCAVVKRVDAGVLGRLFPLMISMEGQQSFQQIFEVRLGLEGQTAYLAAMRRSRTEVQRLNRLVETFHEQVERRDFEANDTDLEFHVQIAQAAKNPMFPILLRALASVVKYTQQESCRNDLARHRRAVESHRQIADAIQCQDAERARVEMLAHLHFSASRILLAETDDASDKKTDVMAHSQRASN